MTEAERGSSWTSLWTQTQYAHNGSVEIAYDTLAGSEGEPLLLVMGLAVSRFWWPAGLCQELAGRGFAVARYDQRDAGQSTRMPDTGGQQSVRRARPEARRLHLRRHDRRRDRRARRARLEAGAHLRRLARRHHRPAHRPATSGPGAQRHLDGRPAERRVWSERRTLHTLRPAGQARTRQVPRGQGRRHPAVRSCSPARWPRPPTRSTSTAAREWIERDIDSGPRDTRAQSRQAGAAWHGPKLRELRKPVLVVHGDQDPLLRVSAARATAKAIEGSPPA